MTSERIKDVLKRHFQDCSTRQERVIRWGFYTHYNSESRYGMQWISKETGKRRESSWEVFIFSEDNKTPSKIEIVCYVWETGYSRLSKGDGQFQVEHHKWEFAPTPRNLRIALRWTNNYNFHQQELDREYYEVDEL